MSAIPLQATIILDTIILDNVITYIYRILFKICFNTFSFMKIYNIYKANLKTSDSHAQIANMAMHPAPNARAP